jgi:hypothetical protein
MSARFDVNVLVPAPRLCDEAEFYTCQECKGHNRCAEEVTDKPEGGEE